MVTFSNITTTTATANWGSVAADGATVYRVERGPDGINASLTEWVYEPDVTKAYTGLTTGTTYYVRVTPYNGATPLTSLASAWTQFTTL